MRGKCILEEAVLVAQRVEDLNIGWLNADQLILTWLNLGPSLALLSYLRSVHGNQRLDILLLLTVSLECAYNAACTSCHRSICFLRFSSLFLATFINRLS